MAGINKCIICGKPRRLVKKIKKRVNNVWVVVTKYECADPKCQKKANEVIKNIRLKNAKFAKRIEEMKLRRTKKRVSISL